MTRNDKPATNRAWLATNLMGLAELRDLIVTRRGHAVSKQRAAEISRHPQFPPPVAELAAGRLWLRPEVEAFLMLERRPGRQTTTPPQGS